MHTTASDGFFSPSEVVKKSFDAGLRIISITDHDSIDGLKEAKEYAKNLNIDVINGIELSAEFEDKEVHILGYFFDETNSELTLKIDEFKNQRYQRIINFVEKLNQKQISISIDDVLEFSKAGTLGRPHIAQALIKKGYASNFYEVFSKFLGNDSPFYVKKNFLAPETAFDLIHRAGGVCIIAHPGAFSEKALSHFVKSGVDGFEVNHPSLSSEQKKFYHEFVRKNHLIGTGGSDFHGGRRNDEINLGKYYIPAARVELLKQRAMNLN